MSPTAQRVRIAEPDPRRRGELFTRLAGDYFLALGYDNCRFNITQSGREVDVVARHRTEDRQIVAECKAHASPIGGADTNKFVGVLDAQRKKAPSLETHGYFLSLSGFRESARQQEQDLPEPRFILVDGPSIANELVQGRVLIPRASAASTAGGLFPGGRPADVRLATTSIELVLHQLGWIWALYYTRHHVATHYALIHADGAPLDPDLAAVVTSADSELSERHAPLTYLAPMPSADLRIGEVEERYLAYIGREYGSITLEGLPADEEVGFKRLDLESLYVPLYLHRVGESSPTTHEELPSLARRIPVGTLLRTRALLAVVAPPGAGKSTLLRRIALAYAYPERRAMLGDGLPERDWLPLVIRCRQLEGLVRRPFLEVLDYIPSRAEMSELAPSFSSMVRRRLKEGSVLLLVDGLDEIADEGDRVSFVEQLRTFLATYPDTSVITTSREPGYRAVAGTLGSICTQYRVADFDDADITALTRSWHRLIVGDSAAVLRDADNLALSIIQADRVRRLARNPLLLTTLLLVKRWLGDLPRRRSVLYDKAIEVLLMTWNVAAHKPIEREEAIPQLAFVAYSMMDSGVQRVSIGTLTELLNDAREQMQELLGFAKVSVPEFVRRVEDRSSLLIRSGQEVDDGVLRATYEFKHLTFQEYLAATALADGYGPRDASDIGTVVLQRVDDDEWREVIPLAAVLSRRRSAEIIDVLMAAVRRAVAQTGRAAPRGKPKLIDVRQSRVALLAQCFADEAQTSPDIARAALELVVRSMVPGHPMPQLREIAEGRYGDLLHEVLKSAARSPNLEVASVASSILRWTTHADLSRPSSRKQLLAGLEAVDMFDLLCALLQVMQAAFTFQGRPTPATRRDCGRMIGRIAPTLVSDHVILRHAGAWAVAWLGAADLVPDESVPDLLTKLFRVWRQDPNVHVQRQAAWAISSLPLVPREWMHFEVDLEDLAMFLGAEMKTRRYEPVQRKRAAVVIGYYSRLPHSPASPEEVSVKLYELAPHFVLPRSLRQSRSSASRVQSERYTGGLGSRQD